MSIHKQVHVFLALHKRCVVHVNSPLLLSATRRVVGCAAGRSAIRTVGTCQHLRPPAADLVATLDDPMSTVHGSRRSAPMWVSTSKMVMVMSAIFQ